MVGRWWSQYRLLPWPDIVGLQLQGLVMLESPAATEFCHAVMRYLVLSYVLCLARISKVHKKQCVLMIIMNGTYFYCMSRKFNYSF